MKITSKGQVTIPQHVRERHGFLPGTEIHFIDDGESVRISKDEGIHRRGRAMIERMRGRATQQLSTDEIMSLTRGDG